jgi:hypothetical protein
MDIEHYGLAVVWKLRDGIENQHGYNQVRTHR